MIEFSFLYTWLLSAGSISSAVMAGSEYPSGSRAWRVFYLVMASLLMTLAIKSV